MAYTSPDVDDFKERFWRDFPYAVPLDDPGDDTNASKVTNVDIELCLANAQLNINSGVFPSQDAFTNGYLLLAAHFLVVNIRAAQDGLDSQFNWSTTQKSVSAIQEAYYIPPWVKDNPWLAQYGTTSYGALYLQAIMPYMVGATACVWGGTNP